MSQIFTGAPVPPTILEDGDAEVTKGDKILSLMGFMF